MEYDSRYICPLTHKILWDPVVASDGIVYERLEIKKIIDSKKPTPCPISNQILQKQVYPLNFLKEDISKFMEQYPEAKFDQYKPYYKDNMDTIKRAIRHNAYDSLKLYLEYDVADMHKNGILITILQECPEYTLLYVLENMINIEFRTKNGWQLVHLICRYCSEYPIEHMLRMKQFNLEACTTKEGLRPIHILSQYSTPKIINDLFTKLSLDVEAETKDGWKPIHFLCSYGSLETIQIAINKGVAVDAYIRKFNNSDVKYGVIDLLKFNTNLDQDEKEYITELIKLKKLKSDVKKTKHRLHQSMRGLKKSQSMMI